MAWHGLGARKLCGHYTQSHKSEQTKNVHATSMCRWEAERKGREGGPREGERGRVGGAWGRWRKSLLLSWNILSSGHGHCCLMIETM